jgi:hypothetical protein
VELALGSPIGRLMAQPSAGTGGNPRLENGPCSDGGRGTRSSRGGACSGRCTATTSLVRKGGVCLTAAALGTCSGELFYAAVRRRRLCLGVRVMSRKAALLP